MNSPRTLATGIAALAALMFSSHTAVAGSSTWSTVGTDGAWNNAANWVPAIIPNGPLDIATFGSTDQLIPFVSLTANTEVSGIIFSSGAPAYSIGGNNFTLTISGTGVTNNSGSVQTLIGGGATGVLRFQGSATAGNGNVGVLAQNEGTVIFAGASTAGAARLGAASNGVVDISGLTTPGMTAGYIITDNTGSNFFRLGSKTLTVGSSNASTTVSGVIADGGTGGGVGGSIVKVGTGTMTYAGSTANTYTGTTFVNEGSLVLNKTVESIRGPLVVGDGVGAAGSAEVQAIGKPNNIQDSQPVTVNSDGRFVLGPNFPESIGPLTVNRGVVSIVSAARLSVTGPLTMTGGTIQIEGGGDTAIDIRNSSIQATSASDGTAATISATASLATAHTFAVGDGPGGTDLLISGTINSSAGTDRIVKAGPGVMVLSGTNHYVGSTTIAAGTLGIASDANLGSPPASPTANHLVFDGGTLRTTAGLTLDANRGITLNAGGGTVEVTTGNLSYSGVIAGIGDLTKIGPGTLGLGGASGNTYTGTTTVNEGTLALFKTSANQAILGPLVIGDGVGAADSAIVQAGSQISDAAPVTIRRDGQLGLDNFINEAIGSLTIVSGNVRMGITSVFSVAGPLDMTGGTIFGGNTTLLGNVNATSDSGSSVATIASIVNLGGTTRTFTINDGPGFVDLNISNIISNGGITKSGAGTFALAGANTYTGPTTIVAGKLMLTGNISGSTTVIANGATLQGTGTTGPLTINSGATLIPGLSVGTLTTGNLTLNAGSISSFELAVASVVGGGINDLVNINGNFTLDGTLVVTELPGFGDGSYPLFDYSGTLTNNGLDLQGSFLAAHPGSSIQIDTVNTRVNLAVVPEPNAFLLVIAGLAMLRLRRTSRIPASRGSSLLAVFMFSSHSALAGTATWRSTGTNGSWNDAANWTPVTVPNGPADVATFGSTDQLAPFALLTANTEVSGIVFNAGAPAWTIGGENVTFTISGTGITNNAGVQGLLATGASGVLRFQNSATAGNANVVVFGQNGGTVLFAGSSTGGGARVFANSTGAVDISGLSTPGMTAGLIAADSNGSNFIRLGSKTLTVGGANLDSTVSGVIADGGTAGGVGGSIVKVGTGTMTYAGGAANTYTGTTFVNEGTLAINKSPAVDAIRGPIVVGDGVGAAGSAVLRLMNTGNILDSQPVTVNGDGRFEVTGTFDTIGPLTVNGSTVSLSGTAQLYVLGVLAMIGGTIEGPGEIIFDRTIQVTPDSAGAAATVSAVVLLPTASTLTVSDGPEATDLLLSGRITGAGGIAKLGEGVMVLGNVNNNYTGSTKIAGGTLSISSDANLGVPPGSPTANHLVFDGGTLRATANFTFHANRGIALDAGGGVIEVTAGNAVNFSEAIVGAGGLTKTGQGSLSFSGASGNTYTGTTTVNDGVLGLLKSIANQAITGPLVIGDGLGAASSAVVQTGLPQISDSAPVTIQPDGKLNVESFASEGIGSLTIAGGNVQIFQGGGLSVFGALAMTGGTIAGGAFGGSTATLFGNVTGSSDAGGVTAAINSNVNVNLGAATRSITVNDGPGAVDLNISGAISNGGITKTGAGTLALAGANTYSGPTTIIAGTLVLTGSISASTTVVANGATLQGTGTTGPLTINSGATLIPGQRVGTLTTANLTLNAGSTSYFELAVAGVVGSGINDLVNINGNFTIDGMLVITELPGFGDGMYPLFDYSGTLTNDGLDLQASFLAAHPGSSIQIDTVNSRVNLAVVPEPHACLLVLAGIATLRLRRS